VINYRSHPAGADTTLDRVRAAGGDGLTVQADAGKVADVQRLVAESVAHFGQLDILVTMLGLKKTLTFGM
jgi:glucose 1-dehydrogenase